jgi:hypothetical protein
VYDAVADLSLSVAEFEYERLERSTSSGFDRATTVVHLRGAGAHGRGEDVTYETDEHDRLRADPPDLPTGEFTFAEFSRALEDVDLFATPPDRAVFERYRRWGVESAALDLALRQADTDLASALGRTYDPVRFVVSTRLDPPTTDRLDALLATDADLEFKLDPTPEWPADLVAELAEYPVRILDLKGQYEGTTVDTPPDPDLYERLVEAFPEAVLEDPAVTEDTRPVLAPASDRLSWDAAVESRTDLSTLPFEPRWLNVKPSRFGTVAELLSTVEHCLERGVACYGGGQFELGVGRAQIQELAALFYPTAPNDVAPGGYNDPDPPGDLPASPLAPEKPVGFGGAFD